MNATEYLQGLEVQTPFRDGFMRVPHPLMLVKDHPPIQTALCSHNAMFRYVYRSISVCSESLQLSTVSFQAWLHTSPLSLEMGDSRSYVYPKIGHECE